jgi:hypothetical protein
MRKNQHPVQHLLLLLLPLPLQTMALQRKLRKQKDHPAWSLNFGKLALMNKTSPSAALAHSAGFSNVQSNAQLNSY